MKSRGTYTIKEKDYTMDIDYTLLYEEDSEYTPGSLEVWVTEFYLDGSALPLNFYYEYIYERVVEGLNEFAWNNK